MTLPVIAKVGLGLAAGFGVYEVFFAGTPPLQSIRSADKKTQIVVPVSGDKPKPGVTAVPPPPGNTPTMTSAYRLEPPPSRPGPFVHPKMPTLITPGGGSNLTVQRIEDVQRALNTLGLATSPMPVTGLLDPLTVATLTHFQANAGLPLTGIIDLPTRKALETALGSLATIRPIAKAVQNATSATGAALSSSLPAILSIKTPTDIQKALNDAGASPVLKVDGVIDGPKTVAAIKAFQIGTGLVADGIAGPKTLTALQAIIAPVVASN